jgi:hypothetical protein
MLLRYDFGSGTNSGIGTPITAIPDTAGVYNNWISAKGGFSGPTASTFSGQTVGSFDGAGFNGLVTNFTQNLVAPFTIFIVSTYPAQTGNAVIFEGNTAGNTTFYESATSQGSWGFSPGLTYSVNTNNWYVTELYSAGATGYVKTNGAVTAATGSVGAAGSLSNLVIGGNFSVTQLSTFKMGYFIMFTNQLSLVNETNMFKWLNNHYGNAIY